MHIEMEVFSLAIQIKSVLKTRFAPDFKVQGLFIRHILNYTGYNQK